MNHDTVRGQVLLELPIVLLLVVLGVGMNLELVRRCRVELFAHHLAFAFARGRALGLGDRKSVV